MIDKVSFLGIKIKPLVKNDLVDILLEFVKGDRPRLAFYLIKINLFFLAE